MAEYSFGKALMSTYLLTISSDNPLETAKALYNENPRKAQRLSGYTKDEFLDLGSGFWTLEPTDDPRERQLEDILSAE